jgi:hypothetical protein
VTWNAVSALGTVLAGTDPEILRLDNGPTKSLPVNLSLDEAIDQAATFFRGEAKDMNELWLGGLEYQHTGAQLELGRLVQGRLTGAMRNAFPNTPSPDGLVVWDRDHCGEELLAQRGETIPVGALAWPPTCASDRAYLMSGHFYEEDEFIDLQVSLEGTEGSRHSWSARISRDDLPAVAPSLPADIAKMQSHDQLGPVGFQLTTDRGTDPAYRVGETMNLMLRLDRPAWVYCYYRDARGLVTPLIPNPYFWQTRTEPRFEGEVLHTIPGPNTYPFEFTVEPPLGVEITKCFAMGRNVTRDLPLALRGTDFESVPADIAARVTEIFESFRDTAMTEASVTITVID